MNKRRSGIRTKIDMIIRKATIDDIQDIIEMAKAFHRESDGNTPLTNERIKRTNHYVISTRV